MICDRTSRKSASLIGKLKIAPGSAQSRTPDGISTCRYLGMGRKEEEGRKKEGERFEWNKKRNKR